jgi:hypothetical protein
MRRLTHAEFVIAADTDSNQIHNLNHRGQAALAFGRSVIAHSLSYIEADALCHRIADVLTKSYTRRLAASFVHVHFDIVANVLAAAEADPKRPKFLSVVDLYARGKLLHTTCGSTTDNAETITAELAQTPLTAHATVSRITSINITALRAEIVASGARKGVELDAPWLPPLGSKDFADLMQPYTELRDRAVATVESAGAKARTIFEGTLQ